MKQVVNSTTHERSVVAMKQADLPLPGVILFSSPRKVLCYDDRAEELLSKTSDTSKQGRKRKFSIPPKVYRCSAEVLNKMRAHPELRDCKDFKVTHLFRHNDIPLLVSALGFPAADPLGGPLVLILVEQLDDQAARLSYQATEMLGLSRDEQAVLHYLLKGWTNKEIAQALSIPEDSIKNHLRCIMTRTHAWTREAVIQSMLRMLGISPV